MNKVALRNAMTRKHRQETRRKKMAVGRKYWYLLKDHAAGYGDQPDVFLDVQAFQKDWLARGSRCILGWYEKIDAEREAIIAKREVRRISNPPAPPQKNLWERFTDWLISKTIGVDIV